MYYFQAVDRFKHPQEREVYTRALQFVNLSESAGLHGMMAAYLGMRVKLTKPLMPPALVQEAAGEIVEIIFHPEERFGHPTSSNILPADTHECWQRGWVRCDRLPLHIGVRFDQEIEDYTGLGRPGVWFVEPVVEHWKLPIDTIVTIDHPGALRAKKFKATSREKRMLDVTRCQLPLTHEDVMTFQNAQGKTIRGPDGEPKGLQIDMSYTTTRPSYMTGQLVFPTCLHDHEQSSQAGMAAAGQLPAH